MALGRTLQNLRVNRTPMGTGMRNFRFCKGGTELFISPKRRRYFHGRELLSSCCHDRPAALVGSSLTVIFKTGDGLRLRRFDLARLLPKKDNFMEMVRRQRHEPDCVKIETALAARFKNGREKTIL